MPHLRLHDSDARDRVLRRALYALYAITVLFVTWQRGFSTHPHWTFPVFRASFHHLVRGQDLYAQWAEHDKFKYSPTVALLFAPFAIPPFALGLFLWDAFNAAMLCWAVTRLLPARAGTLALALLYTECLCAMQASQSNSLVAALFILAFLGVERQRTIAPAFAIATGAFIKIFPLAALTFGLFHRRRTRFALAVAGAMLALLALPLLVVSPHTLLAEYRSWRAIEAVDALDKGASVMGLCARWLHLRVPNWPIQLAGTLLLLLPLALRRERWSDATFRLHFLASVLVYVVLFNHQAERPSFVIAAAGGAIWFATSARAPWRAALLLLSLVGLEAAGYLPLWIAMQAELLGAFQPNITRHVPRAEPAPFAPAA
jgi:hypothetical protein